MNSRKANNDVTVITITRHRPDILGRAISSVQNQSYSCGNIIHLILIDDCHDTWRILQSKKMQPGAQLHFFRRTPGEKSGPARLAKLRNISAKLAKTRWICFLDDDNEFTQEHLETLVNIALENKCRAAHSYLYLFNSNGTPYLDERLPWSRDPVQGQIEYQKLKDRGVFQAKSNIVCDRIDPFGVDDPVRTVDTGEWVFERTLLLEHPFPEEYTDADWISMTTEDDKLIDVLVRNRIRIACTQRPTLKYYLGGYSNTFQLD